MSLVVVILCLMDSLAPWICSAREKWLWDLLLKGARVEINTANPWRDYFSEERNLSECDGQDASLPPVVEMMPRFPYSPPALPLSQEKVEANIDHFFQPVLDPIPRPKLSLLKTSIDQKTKVAIADNDATHVS